MKQYSLLEGRISLHTKEELNFFFEKYYETLVLFANRYLPQKDDCKDLVQDVFVNLWENKKTFPDEIYLRVFLYKTVRNKCFNVVKHNKVKDKYAAHVIHSLQDEDSFMKQIIEKEIVRQLHTAVEVLPTRKKQVITLSLKGFKNKEIAEQLGIKLQTVKTLRSQSYKVLRSKFKKMDILISFLLSR